MLMSIFGTAFGGETDIDVESKNYNDIRLEGGKPTKIFLGSGDQPIMRGIPSNLGVPNDNPSDSVLISLGEQPLWPKDVLVEGASHAADVKLETIYLDGAASIKEALKSYDLKKTKTLLLFAGRPKITGVSEVKKIYRISEEGAVSSDGNIFSNGYVPLGEARAKGFAMPISFLFKLGDWAAGLGANAVLFKSEIKDLEMYGGGWQINMSPSVSWLTGGNGAVASLFGLSYDEWKSAYKRRMHIVAEAVYVLPNSTIESWSPFSIGWPPFQKEIVKAEPAPPAPPSKAEVVPPKPEPPKPDLEKEALREKAEEAEKISEVWEKMAKDAAAKKEAAEKAKEAAQKEKSELLAYPVCPVSLEFPFNEWQPNSAEKQEKIPKMAAWYVKNYGEATKRNLIWRLNGNADERGPAPNKGDVVNNTNDKINPALSEWRAKWTKALLAEELEKLGQKELAKRIVCSGSGKTNPAKPQAGTELEHQENRRVYLILSQPEF